MFFRSRLGSDLGWLIILAIIRFTVAVDFLIMAPMGPELSRVMSLSPAAFGHAVAAYAFSAGLFSLVAAVILDKFHRKTALVTIYTGFVLSTLVCGLAQDYLTLIMGRIVAGACGGVITALVLVMVGDEIPEEKRGEATGLVMSSFAMASVLGVPLGILSMAHGSWHAPFLFLAGVSFLVLIAAILLLPTFARRPENINQEPLLERMHSILAPVDHQRAYVLMILITLAGFILLPYIATYLVKNVGLAVSDLSWGYFCGGAFTLFSMNWIGAWADRAGKYKVFSRMSFFAVFVTLILTNLPVVPVVITVIVQTAFMVGMTGRMVPALAMVTGTVEARNRGGFMSINSFVQQMASGTASSLAGLLLSQTPDGKLVGFPLLGIISCSMALIAVILGRQIKSELPRDKVTNTVSEEVLA